MDKTIDGNLFMTSSPIHPKALVEKGAKLGSATRVWAFTHIQAGARLGTNCNIGDHVFLEKGSVLGNFVTVKNGVSLWEGVHTEDGVFIGPACVFTNHLLPRAFRKEPAKAWLKPTLLKEGCTLGANATILAGITIGQCAFVAAGSVVTKSVPDFALVMGNPARFDSWRCFCGEALTFRGTQAICSACKERFSWVRRENRVTSLATQNPVQRYLKQRRIGS